MKGFGRIAVATPDLHLGDPASNAAEHLKAACAAAAQGVDVLAFPELSLTGYTCGDLFFRDDFLDAARQALRELAAQTADLPLALVVGVPLKIGSGIFNAAVVLSGGQVRGSVPKTYLPTYGEYYEHRQFTSAAALPPVGTVGTGPNPLVGTVGTGPNPLGTGPIPCATNLVFSFKNIKFSVEICEDLWVPIPPSSRLAHVGLDCVFNLSASTEFLGKAAHRELRVLSQSAALRCAYAMASAGVGESSSDAVFGGQSLIAADGKMLKKGRLFGRESEIVSATVDFAALAYRRRSESSLNETGGADLGSVPARLIACDCGDSEWKEGLMWRREDGERPELTQRCGEAEWNLKVGTGPEKNSGKCAKDEFLSDFIDPHPFLTAFGESGWVEKTLAIQSVALARRMEAAHAKKLVIGVSGGADSALALLAASRAVARACADEAPDSTPAVVARACADEAPDSTLTAVARACADEAPDSTPTAVARAYADEAPDSTPAAIARACDNEGLAAPTPAQAVARAHSDAGTAVIAVVMPGFASSDATQARAVALAESVGADVRVVDIRAACRRHLADIGHDEATHDLAFENVQARERTQVLMDIANMEGALVVGTGDLSEIALGWNTYNGDHMSMYQVNASVPKTMVLAALREVAARSSEPLGPLLREIADAPITPELVPDAAANDSEARLGPYELHDFFLYHFLANGASSEKLRLLAEAAFRDVYSPETIARTCATFWRRFFASQYKRNCVPDGPKITLSLSPRADWRMPSDGSPERPRP